MVTVADTAFSIACVRADEAALPEGSRLFEDPYAHVFAAQVGEAREATERYLALPMFRDGIRLRTRFIDDAVREAIAGGLRQVVLLGAGFDARGLRLPEVAATGTKVFEVDVPMQVERKARWLREAGIMVPSAVVGVPFDFDVPDFEEALGRALAERGFDLDAGAVFVWEGVIGYIDDAAIERSLRFMSRAAGARGRLVFSGHEGAFAPETAEERLKRHGFAACVEVGLDVVWRRLLPTKPPEYAGVSRLAVATK